MYPTLPGKPLLWHTCHNVSATFLRFTKVVCLLLLLPALVSAQLKITEIITDYNGFWKSGHSSLNPVKPDNSHNLLSFTYNNVCYSTGVNDSLLTAHGESFTTGDYKALPVAIIGNVNGNTKIGLGAMYDGVYNGPSNPRPVNNPARYLADGLKGLDLGTCVANLPASEVFFAVTNLHKEAIGDTIPDLIVTQIADPSSSSDYYEFTDINGNRIGNGVHVVLNKLLPVGYWTADFYEASTHPMQLTGGFTQTDRPLRFWAADFDDFGIDSNNIKQIAYFKIRISGNSDVAFVAYNNNTFTIETPLPVKLLGFTARTREDVVQLSWMTSMESNTGRFIVEVSLDDNNFIPAGEIEAAGTGIGLRQYRFEHHPNQAGVLYYRLKTTGLDGTVSYSKTIIVQHQSGTALQVKLYPNPAASHFSIRYPVATGGETIRVVNSQGLQILLKTLTKGSHKTDIEISHLPAGLYQVLWSNGTSYQSIQLLKQP